MVALTSLGVELEMVIADRASGASHCVGPFFANLRALKRARGMAAVLDVAYDGRDLAVSSARGCTSLDNGYNNIESAIGPVGLDGRRDGLHQLHAWTCAELAEVREALAAEGAAVLNFSQHPALAIDDEGYRRIRAPKPIYDYWIEHRGWDHKAGIDAKAQNGPTTGVGIGDAVFALNAVLAASPAFIALFGNSPFENGRVTGLRESRLTIWPRMFRQARFAADDRLHRVPARPFTDLRDYFEWMFGEGTRMQLVPCRMDSDYKGLRDTAWVAGHPSLLEFLRGRSWPATHLGHGGSVSVEPSVGHLAFQQFAHFLDARIRFGFVREPSLEAFFEAWERPHGMEELLASTLDFCYIEGRSPGANFADREIVDLAGEEVARSITIAPSALQAGLLRNAAALRPWLARQPWAALAELREAAVRDGLAGRAGEWPVRRLCEEVVAIAADGLEADEQWMLAYPLHVLRSGCNGADRALSAYERLAGSPAQRIGRLIEMREALFFPAAAEAVQRV
ncbi:glutamate-cysteine ligase family protein [Pseudothauera rhizosphaerae]|uniref:Glutamate--cysteine ligase n=1 Tax=Pseudothauera rhizosphaerae TaxID=2565932 RepID=A0A4S4AE08_9RHOO|nr:glutamate-cysteine ligase family protein [Pseudothauera rhizosphaerae]THF57250.1 hypothetical protein E6O51_18305 [Pseudothauera rhizosphaerae]